MKKEEGRWPAKFARPRPISSTSLRDAGNPPPAPPLFIAPLRCAMNKGGEKENCVETLYNPQRIWLPPLSGPSEATGRIRAGGGWVPHTLGHCGYRECSYS